MNIFFLSIYCRNEMYVSNRQLATKTTVVYYFRDIKRLSLDLLIC